MRIAVLLLLAFLAIPAFGQPTVIDSMLIDEGKGVLSVYGSFGPVQGKVWCDSVELPVLTWSDTLVTATIPDTGRGSAGGVVVEVIGGNTDMKILTCWKFTFRESTVVHHPSGGETTYRSSSSFSFRSSIECKILTRSPLRVSYPPMFVDFEEGFMLYPPHREHKIQLEFDSIFQILAYSIYDFGPNGEFHTEGIIDTSTIFPPRMSITTLVNSVELSLPQNYKVDVEQDNCILLWSTLNYMDAYHVQLSKDSIINGQKSAQHQQAVTYFVDTIITSLDFHLPHLEKNTKYYWHVCGVNTEGESRWSDVWSFTTGTSADVKQEEKVQRLQVYPNPATSEVTIVTAEPTRLFLYDITGKMLRTCESNGEATLNISTLPAGNYVFGTSQGEMRVVQIVK